MYPIYKLIKKKKKKTCHIALRWILSSLFTFLLVNGHQTTEQYFRFDLTREQCKVFITSMWEFQHKPLLVNIPKSVNSLTSSRTVSLKCTLLVNGTCFFSNSHDFALFGVEIYQVALAPMVKFIQIVLEKIWSS